MKRDIKECKHLFEGKYNEEREVLIGMLVAAGYTSKFRDKIVYGLLNYQEVYFFRVARVWMSVITPAKKTARKTM